MKQETMQKNKWLMVLFLLVIIIPTHVIGIDKFITFDEPWWVISGSNYYYALTHGDFENTLYDYHPAVTTTWVVAAGMLSYFPEYRGFGQGYFDVRKPKFEDFMRAHDKEAIDLVRYSRLIQTALITVLAISAFFLLCLLVDPVPAFLGIALAMNAPYYLGHSRLLNHEGMLAIFILVSFLGMQVYLNKERKPIYLLGSAAALGLAQLTKSSSIVLIALVGLMIFVDLFNRDEQSWGLKIWSAIKIFATWLAVSIIVYVALWPGMWVAPGKMLYEVYGNAFSYAFQGARLDVTYELQPSTFKLETGFSTVINYLNVWRNSSTPISWIGLILALFCLGSKDKRLLPTPIKSTIVYLGILAALFILIFGLAQGRNASHYILSSFVCLDVVAGIGWGCTLIWAQKRWIILDRVYIYQIVFLLLIAFQIKSVLPYYPYYYNYKNPIISGSASYGIGEGLELAAEYLEQMPNAGETKVYAYGGMGSLSFFYSGDTSVLKKVYLRAPEYSDVISGMRESNYLVLYSALQNNQPESVKLLRILQVVQPEKIIFIKGIEYVRIYKTADIPESIYDEMSR